MSLKAFTERYRKWCRRRGCNFSEGKAAGIHGRARTLFPLIPKTDVAKLMVKEAVIRLNTVSRTVEVFRARMNSLASRLPEYEAVMGMTGVGPSVGPQLMAEIGDLRRFEHRKSLAAFAGTAPGRSSKRGSPYPRKTLFVIMSVLIQLRPAEDTPDYD